MNIVIVFFMLLGACASNTSVTHDAATTADITDGGAILPVSKRDAAVMTATDAGLPQLTDTGAETPELLPFELDAAVSNVDATVANTDAAVLNLVVDAAISPTDAAVVVMDAAIPNTDAAIPPLDAGLASGCKAPSTCTLLTGIGYICHTPLAVYGGCLRPTTDSVIEVAIGEICGQNLDRICQDSGGTKVCVRPCIP